MFLAMVFVLGWFCGAGVNVLADALPYRRRVGSCPVCGARISARGALGVGRFYGGCGHLRGSRSRWLPFLGGLGAVGLWLFPPPRLNFWISWAVLVYFAAVVVMDVEHRLILHVMSGTGAVLGGALGVWRHGVTATLLGGAAGFGGMLVLYWFGGWFGAWVARRRGDALDEVALGFGDVNLSGVMGLMLGWPGVAAGLVVAILLGGVFSGGYVLWMLVRRRYRAFEAIPYGPFVALATVWLLLWA